MLKDLYWKYKNEKVSKILKRPVSEIVLKAKEANFKKNPKVLKK